MTRNDIKRQTLIEWGKKCEISSHKVFARLENISTIVFSEYEVTKKKKDTQAQWYNLSWLRSNTWTKSTQPNT